MTTGVVRLAGWSTMALAILLVAPAIAPWDRTVHGAGEALVLGLVAGALLFAALARQGLPAGVFAAPPRRLAARSAILLAKSVQEEAVWRALVLGLLVAPLGRLAALVTSTLVFAGAHVPHQGRAALAQLLTGSTFGSVYLLTGRIHAAMAAHALYNVLVGAALLAEEPLSVLDNGRARTSVVASGESPVRRPMPPPSSTAQPPVVARLEGVSKSFGRTRALAGIDLELRRGEILALLGPNGAGKSTAVAILLGLRRPDAGEATLFDRDPRSPATRRQIGAVLQEISFPPGLRVRETVDLVRAHFDDPQRTDALLSRLGLESKADRDAGGLSGGQRRRLAVALALAGRPDVLFLDEPTAGLDAGARRSLLGDVVSFAGEGGAVLLTTQQLSEAEEIASRVVVLVEGRVLHEGTVKETRAHGGVARVVFRSSAPPPREGVISIESRGNRHVVLVDDPDTYVTRLVQQGVDFRELEVAHSSLEDAFVALTGEPQT